MGRGEREEGTRYTGKPANNNSFQEKRKKEKRKTTIPDKHGAGNGREGGGDRVCKRILTNKTTRGLREENEARVKVQKEKKGTGLRQGLRPANINAWPNHPMLPLPPSQLHQKSAPEEERSHPRRGLKKNVMWCWSKKKWKAPMDPAEQFRGKRGRGTIRADKMDGYEG